MKDVRCDYCGTSADFVDSAMVYGKSYGMIYLCPQCHAFVGVHKGSDRPLGRLANAELRAWKSAAHAVFDLLWKRGGPFYRRRDRAYIWLAGKMGLPPGQTHIGMFDVPECKKVIDIIYAERSALEWK